METNMSKRILSYAMLLAFATLMNGPLWAQSESSTDQGNKPASVSDPYKAYLPDPAHIPFILPQNIHWEGQAGREQHYNVMGDPRKPGPYIQILKWWPGNFSKPHYHEKPRYVTVLSGTWWVSSSNHFDPNSTYPIPAGSLVQDIVNTVHWDGAKAGGEPVVLEIVGEGPAPNISVDENGKPIEKNF